MRCGVYLLLLVLLSSIIGCSRATLSGTYRAEIRLVEGKQESPEKGYSLAEVQARAAQDQRTLVLRSDGRYEWRSGDFTNEGKWRTERDTLILRDDISNGNRILPALQKDRRWRIANNSEIINEGTYSHYNLIEVYTRSK